jgi:hypothetical protein
MFPTRLPALLFPLLTLIGGQEPQVADAKPAAPELEGFEFAAGKQNVGRVYQYEKSNVDGTNKSRVDLYVASESRIESFKHHVGARVGTLVSADMDWMTLSVKKFETVKLDGDGNRKVTATLNTKGDELHCKMGKDVQRVKIAQFPWHSYDFDFASLNITLRYLEDPEGVVQVGIMDFGLTGMTNLGFVEIEYLDDAKRGEFDCRHYLIDGPGLDDRGGEMWVRKSDDPIIVDYEIDKPDESSMRSGKMRLLGTKQLSKEEWAEHMKKSLNP